MDSPRQFMCKACCALTLICSSCDHCNRYCSKACALGVRAERCQAGKTTLVCHMAEAGLKYLTLGDELTLLSAHEDPVGMMLAVAPHHTSRKSHLLGLCSRIKRQSAKTSKVLVRRLRLRRSRRCRWRDQCFGAGAPSGGTERGYRAGIPSGNTAC